MVRAQLDLLKEKDWELRCKGKEEGEKCKDQDQTITYLIRPKTGNQSHRGEGGEWKGDRAVLTYAGCVEGLQAGH